MLEARSVRAGYGRREILHGIDLCLREREVVAIVGPNGSGKTTLLRVLCGVLRPSSGSVEVDGAALGALDPRARARRIAVVPQTFTTPFAFTVREVAGLGRAPYVTGLGWPSRADRAAVGRALEWTDCAAIAERPVTELSGGERQRAVLAMALAQESKVLLLDEPTVHLDPAHQRATLDLVRTLARDRGLVAAAVLHDLNLAAAMCDRIVVLESGRVAADGPPAGVIDASTVARVFGPGLVVGDRAGVPFVLPSR